MASRGVRVSRGLGTAAFVMLGVTVATVVATSIGVRGDETGYGSLLPMLAGGFGILLAFVLGFAAVVVRMFSRTSPEEELFSWRRRGVIAFCLAVVVVSPFLASYAHHLSQTNDPTPVLFVMVWPSTFDGATAETVRITVIDSNTAQPVADALISVRGYEFTWVGNHEEGRPVGAPFPQQHTDGGGVALVQFPAGSKAMTYVVSAAKEGYLGGSRVMSSVPPLGLNVALWDSTQ